MLATCPPLNLACQSLTVICGPPDTTKRAPDVSGTHRTRAQRGSQRCSIIELGAPDAFGAHRTHTQRGLQNPLTPDTHHRTHSERPVLSVRHPLLKSGHTGRMNREHPASSAVRPVLNHNRAKHLQHTGRSGQRPVPLRIAFDESHDFKFPIGAIENIHLIFSKAPNLASQTRWEGERNPHPSQP